MINSDTKLGGDSVQSIAKRRDGSIRQIVVQNTKGEVIGMGYFPPGTFMEDSGWKSKLRYHWIDAWEDSELLDKRNELIFDQEMINKLRDDAKVANEKKEYVVESLEKYKRK